MRAVQQLQGGHRHQRGLDGEQGNNHHGMVYQQIARNMRHQHIGRTHHKVEKYGEGEHLARGGVLGRTLAHCAYHRTHNQAQNQHHAAGGK